MLMWPGIVSAQSYSVDWHSIDGGGGTSSGGLYSISGTIGQPDAFRAATGGNFSLTGGFWSVLPATTPPRLTIYRTNANRLVISWPSPSSGFILGQTPALESSNWSLPAESIIDDGTNKYIIVNTPSGNRFYQLLFEEGLD